MAKAKGTKAAAARVIAAPRKRGRAAHLAELAATLDAATGLPDTHGDKKLIALPRKGPGRRRMVPANSIDGYAAQLATELAADLLDKCREVADRMVREAVARLLRQT